MVCSTTSDFYFIPGLFRYQPDHGGGGSHPAQLRETNQGSVEVGGPSGESPGHQAVAHRLRP